MRKLRMSRKILGFVLFVVIGSSLGLGTYTFFYAKGISYLGSDPRACVNCHVMRPQYDAWMKGSHRHVATCNDCHTPHNFVGKYLVKAINGFNHSLAFTTGHYPESIRINRMNLRVTESTCRSCHAILTHSIVQQGEISCISCHRNVGHLH